MKKLFGLLGVLFILFSFTTKTELTKTFEETLEGTWELMDRYNYDGNQVTDTILNLNGYRQVKIFSKGKVMWTRYSPDDPAEWFGYGEYLIDGNTLEERLEFGSKNMMKVKDTVRTFKFELEVESDYYKQITVDAYGNRSFSENYKRID